MSKFYIIGIITFASSFVSARNPDLIVKSNGESIKCTNDSVPENNIKPYNFNFTKKISVSRLAKKDSISTMADIKKISAHSQFLSFEFPSINFEVIAPLGNAVGLTFGVGGIYDNGKYCNHIQNSMIVFILKHTL